MIKHKLSLLSIVAVPIVFLCINNPSDNDDTPPDIGRVIKGRMVDSNGKPISGATIRLFPSNFVPSLLKKAAISNDTTDGNGSYQIPVTDSGVYNLEGLNDSLGVFIDSIIIPDDSEDVVIPDTILKPLGAIKGISYMPGQNDTNQVRVTLYIPGTSRITKPAIGGMFSFNNIAEGRYQIILDPTLDEYNVKIIDTAINAGDTLDLDSIELPLFIPDTITISSSSIYGEWGSSKFYKVINNMHIPFGTSLTIKPGTTVMVESGVEIIAEGKLIANGTPDSMIVFKSCLDNEFWPAISSIDSGEGIQMSNCIIRNSEYGIFVGDVNMVLDIHNCLFKDNRVGIHIEDNDGETIIYSCNFINNNNSIYFSSLNFKNSFNFFNCIFANNDTGITIRPSIWSNDTVSVEVGFSCFFQNNIDYNLGDSLSYLDTISIIYSDPQFVSDVQNSEDYHLRDSSACRNAGIDGTDMGIYSTYNP